MASELATTTEPTSSTTQEPLNAHQRNLHNYVFRSMKRSHDMFLHNYEVFPEIDVKALVLNLYILFMHIYF